MELEGKNYCGLTIDCNYYKEYVEISILTYTPKDIKHFLHPVPKNPCYAPQK